MLPQWEQDEIHEAIDAGMTLPVICRCSGLAQFEVSNVAAAYRAYLSGASDTPYLVGTKVAAPPEVLEKKLTTPRIKGQTEGRQVF
jgi:hypothetical protein